MIADLHGHTTAGNRTPEDLEKALMFVVAPAGDGAKEIRFLRHPQDIEGVSLRLSAREVEDLVHALATERPAFVYRDDCAERSLGFHHGEHGGHGA